MPVHKARSGEQLHCGTAQAPEHSWSLGHTIRSAGGAAPTVIGLVPRASAAVGMPAANGSSGGGAKQSLGLRARIGCIALAVYSCLLANGLSGLQERLLSRG